MKQKAEKNNTKKIAASAMLAALSFSFLYIGTLTGVLDLCAVVVGALACAFAVIEMGAAWAWAVAAVTGTLSLLLLPDKFPAVEYVFLGGIYPILKSYIERLPKVTSWLIKLLYFNVVLTVGILFAKYVLSVSDDWAVLNAVVYAFGNVFFVVFDVALTLYISVYILRWRKKFKFKL